MSGWTDEELERFGSAEELEVTSRRADGTLRGWTPIWVVRVADDVYVRTWYRRDTGWFGRAVATGRLRVRVTGLEADVVVQDVGLGTIGLRADVDRAYGEKYGPYGQGTVDRMTGADAAAATLRLVPDRGPSGGRRG